MGSQVSVAHLGLRLGTYINVLESDTQYPDAACVQYDLCCSGWGALLPLCSLAVSTYEGSLIPVPTSSCGWFPCHSAGKRSLMVVVIAATMARKRNSGLL